MPGKIGGLLAVQELCKRCHIVAHGAVGRRHHRRRPGHHVITGEDDLCSLECECHVVCSMAGCGYRLQAPSIAAHHVTINKLEIGMEFAVTTGIEARRFIEVELPRSAMRPLTEGWR